MLDLEKLEIILTGFKKNNYEATVTMDAERIELSLRKQCPTRGKWYGMTRHLTWIEVESASFDIIERTFHKIETELVRDALLDAQPVPRYEDQVILRQPVTGNDVFKPWPDDGPRPFHQGRHKPGLASK